MIHLHSQKACSSLVHTTPTSRIRIHLRATKPKSWRVRRGFCSFVGSIWMFSKIVIPPTHPLKNRVFHYFHHPFWRFSTYFRKHPYTQLVVFFSISKGSPPFFQVWKEIQIFPSNVVFGFFFSVPKVWKFHRNDPQDPWLPDILTDMSG